ncbi:ferredoxin [Nocardioides sp.]|uniref:ferredoxin n=1 Tax=Nocardioides sp. TaxID=35761 RepID=UPI0031FF425C|nr:Ferredoxin-2 [Nocardioides sp.]
MEITIDRDKCIGSGACVLASPEVFDQDEDGIVVVLDESPGSAEHASVLEAVRACPARVIEVE